MLAVAKQQNFAYWGDRADWLIVIGKHRDSEALGRSNFRVVHADLLKRFPESIAIEEAGHDLVGWVETVLVDPANTEAVEAAQEWQEYLDDHIYADEDDFSNEEWEETLETIEAIRHEVERSDHTPLPEHWESPNGYSYTHTCAKCGQVIEFSSDTGNWDVPYGCVEDES